MRFRLIASCFASWGISLAATPANPGPKTERPGESLPSIFTPRAPTKDALSERAPPLARSTMRAEISAAIRGTFAFAPQSLEEELADSAAASESEIVRMTPFHVTGVFEDKALDRAMAEKERKLKVAVFNFKDGGTILKLGPAELKLKYDPEHKGWDILKMRW